MENTNNNNNNLIYMLYKKCFNNYVISTKIYGFVRSENKNKSSLRSHDMTMEGLLRTEQYSLFDDYINYYINVALKDPSKYYWYGLNEPPQGSESSRGTIIQLLEYRELGFDRFKIIYNQFEKSFKLHHIEILNIAAKGGNYQIYQFLKEVKDCDGDRLYKLKPISFINNLSIIYNNGGCFQIFIDLYLNYYNNNSSYAYYHLLDWLVKNKQDEQFIFLIENHKEHYSDIFLIGLAFKHLDTKLLNYVYSMSSTPEQFTIQALSTFGTLDYRTPILYLDFKMIVEYLKLISVNISDSKEFFEFYLKNTFKIANFNFKDAGYNKDIIINQLKDGYYPSFEEFKFLVDFENGSIINQCPNIVERTTTYVSTKLFDLEYLDYILNYLFSKSSIYDNFDRYLVDYKKEYQETRFQISKPNACLTNTNLYNTDAMQNFKLFREYVKDDPSKVLFGKNNSSFNNIEYIFINSRYNILDYVVNELNIKPSNSPFSNRRKSEFIRLLIGEKPRRLCYFVENDKHFIISNLSLIISFSCFSNHPIVLNFIFNSPIYDNEENGDFKLLLLLKVIVFSIPLLLTDCVGGGSSWIFDLKFIPTKQLQNNDQYLSQFIKDNHTTIFKNVRQINSLRKYYSNYIEPSLETLSQLNPFLVGVIQTLIE